MFHRNVVLLFAILSLSAAASGEAPVITLAGSSTITRLLLPLKAGVEAAHGVEIRLLPNGSGRGLAELAAGRAQAAMLSGPVDYLLAKVDAVSSTGLHLEQLEQLKLASTPKAEVVALVHPTNQTRHLTTDQLRRILTGEIVNWNALGGPDLPIVVVLPDELDGVRASVATALLPGHSFVTTARITEKLSDILPLIAGNPGAIGLVARVTLNPDSVWAEIEPHLSVPLYLVARREILETDTQLELVLNSLHSRAR